MAYKAVIFDLDGTLLDTLGDLAAAVNRVLAARGYPTHETDAFRWFIGDGSAKLMERALPPAERRPEIHQPCLQALLADYNKNWHDITQPYDGIEALLDYLADRQVTMAVVTNKPHQFTGVMIDYYFKNACFDPVFGQREGIPKKPDPQQALAAARSMAVPPEQCIFLGDSAVDMETATRAGMAAVGAGWGFRPVDELRTAGALTVLDHPLDLIRFLEQRP